MKMRALSCRSCPRPPAQLLIRQLHVGITSKRTTDEASQPAPLPITEANLGKVTKRQPATEALQSVYMSLEHHHQRQENNIVVVPAGESKDHRKLPEPEWATLSAFPSTTTPGWYPKSFFDIGDASSSSSCSPCLNKTTMQQLPTLFLTFTRRRDQRMLCLITIIIIIKQKNSCHPLDHPTLHLLNPMPHTSIYFPGF